MRARGANARLILLFGFLSVYACSGSVSCSGCGGLPFSPIPGGFDPEARITRGAQVRVTQGGLDFVESEFQSLMRAYMRMDCGRPEDPPCPTTFQTVPGGAPNPSICVQNTCLESATATPGPLVGFSIDRTEESGAIICRDDPASPTRRPCYAWLRFEGLDLVPQAPNRLRATITAQVDTTQIPFRYNTLGMDCIVRVNSAQSGSPLQDLVVEATLGAWSPPGGGGGQLRVEIGDVTANIPDADVQIARDPIHGDLADIALCGIANLGPVKNALIPLLTRSLGRLVRDEVDEVLGWRCPGAEPCPAGTTCSQAGFCAEANGRVVPNKLGFEGRMDLAGFLAGFAGGRAALGDAAVLVGGGANADNGGIGLGALGGAEVVSHEAGCGPATPSPRTRPGWTTPPPLPNAARVDLDFDGTPETSYMVAAGISEALVHQFIWTIYSTGLLCTSIGAHEVELLNTASLGLLVPSLNQLTRADRDPRAVYPARITLRPSSEPIVRLGSGRTSGSAGMPVVEEPLIELTLRDLDLGFFAVVDERWVRLMTVRLDLALGLGAVITPTNGVQLVLGDLSRAVTNVRVENSELLAEDPADLADALPALLELALPQITGALAPFDLPSAAELGGFELEVLGVRGVEGGGRFPNVAVYADLSFDPTQAGRLSVAAETVATVDAVELPAAADLSVSRRAERRVPRVILGLGGVAPLGRELEHQLRINGGLWSPFFRGERLTLERAELSVQGRHLVEVRSRVRGDYRSLDPTPVALEVIIDPEPPRLSARLALAEGGLYASAYDVVSGDRVTLEVAVDGAWRAVTPRSDGFVALPEVVDAPDAAIAVAAVDEAGNRAERVLRRETLRGAEAVPEAPSLGGCRCASRSPGASALAALLVLGLLAPRLRRRG